MRYIDADKLIADLEHDIAVDTDMILYPGTDNMKASLYQSDKDIKQNCIDILIETPSADVRENVRGEWIEKYYESNETGETVFHGMIMCSVCGHVPKVGWLSNFCPNCGAEMRGKN